jgi:hypothetical protein
VVYLYLDRAHYWYEKRKASRKAKAAPVVPMAPEAH